MRSPIRARSAVSAIASTSSAARWRRRCSSWPLPASQAPCRSISSTTSSTPSPLAATVLTMGHPPALVGAAVAQRQHVAQVAHDRVGAVAVGLVDHEDVGDLEDAGLGRLDAVAHPGREQHERGVGQRGDLHLGLPDADRLDEHDVAAGRRQHAQRLRRRPGQPAEVAAAGHRADEDPVVGGVVLHAHPVAEQRPAGERRARVDREHADPHPATAVRRHQRAGRGRLADARRPGQPDDPGVPGPRREQRHDLAQRRGGVLDEADQPRDRTRLAVAEPVDEVGDVEGAPGAPAVVTSRPAPAASSASPWPPPPHSAAAPVPPPRRLQLEREVQRDAGAGHRRSGGRGRSRRR